MLFSILISNIIGQFKLFFEFDITTKVSIPFGYFPSNYICEIQPRHCM